MFNINVLIPLAPGFEELEAVSIIDILRRAKIGVRISSIEERDVAGAHGIKIIADSDFADEVVEDYDAIVLPGGTEGAKRLYSYTPLKTALMSFASEGRVIAAICASPALVFAELGLLDKRRATCYPCFKSHLKDYVDEAVVVDQNIITSQGPGTAIAFSLKLVEILADLKIAQEIKEGMLL
ncbi:MAG TPA: DJ-1 family glyoxalase III [Myxococcota bacterium]|nr:DJ-1 family glyoxalase III [Myxococcota bacterium]